VKYLIETQDQLFAFLAGNFEILKFEDNRYHLKDDIFILGENLIQPENPVEKQYKIIEFDDEDLGEMLDHINDHEILAFDTETTGLNVLSDTVIGFSISGKIGVGYYLPLYTYSVEADEIQKTKFYDSGVRIMADLAAKKLVTWNGGYDFRILKNDLGIDLKDSLYAEVQLMKHTVDEVPPFGLKPTAIKYQEELGLNMEEAANEEQLALKANVKKNGGETTQKNYEMYKADLSVMGPYACADADLTFRLFKLFSRKLEVENLEVFFYETEVMPLYKKVTIGMDSAGIKLDLPIIEKAYSEIKVDILNFEKQVIAELLDTEIGEKWFFDMVALKYPAKKTGKFGQQLVSYFEIDLPRTKAGKYSMGKKNLEGLTGFVADFLKTGDPEHLDPEDILKIQIEIWDEENETRINISSKTQLGDLAFNYMKMKPLGRTKGGKPQFDDTFIQHLDDEGVTWAKTLGNYNKLVKIKGSYMERFLDNNIDGKFYFYYKQHGTISGRYSSDAQQLPRPKGEGELDPIILKYNNMIRSFFVANEGMVFIDADYESLEPHVFAAVSGDEGLKDIFRKGHDFYSTIAIKTEKMTGVSADKKADNYLGKVDKPKRQTAKAYCLGIPYGMEAYALGKSLDIDTKDADRLIRGYLNGFPELKKWMVRSNLEAQIEGYVASKIGRIRHLPKVKDLFSRYGNKLKNWKFRKSLEKQFEKEEISKMTSDYKNGLNNAKNFQIQSLGASIVNIAMIQINDYFTENNINGKVVCTVHDQIICEVPQELAAKLAPIIEEIMCNCYDLGIKLKAPAEIGDNWRDTH